MKPNFALDLSHEGINLLHRAKGGWTLVGSVALDDPHMRARLDELRRSAAMLESGGITTKVIIPDSQILYTTLPAPGPDDIAREVQIRAALDGLTPYPVGELVFDWRAVGAEARVAVLARETMDEAENFAAQHKFNPVSFVARPGRGEFSGEPFFGKTRAATRILPPGERIEPDANPVPRGPRASAAPGEESGDHAAEQSGAAAAPEPVDPPLADLVDEPGSAPGTPPSYDPDDPFAELDKLAAELSGEAREAEPEMPPAPKPRRKRTSDAPRVEVPALAPFPPTPDEIAAAPAPTPRPFIPKPEAKPKPTPEPRSGGAKDAPEAAPEIAAPERDDTSSNGDSGPSFASTRAAPGSGSSASAKPAARVAGMTARVGIADAPEDDEAAKPPAMPLPPPMRPDRIRAQMADALAKPLPRPGQTPQPEPKGPGFAARLSGRVQAAAAAAAEKRAARKAEAAEAALSNTTPQAPPAAEPDVSPKRAGFLRPRREPGETEKQRKREAEALTVFGARKAQASRDRPKYLGLVLTLVLLLLMAAVAVWSTFVIDNGETGLFNPDPAPAAESTATAAPDPDVPGESAPAAPDLPATAEVLSLEAAQARYAATGIWQRAPEVPEAPETTRLDQLDIAALAPAVPGRQPTPLPDSSGGAVGDAALAGPVPPPPPGTTFDLDAAGLVVPTPEGALSPTGVLVYSGRPAVVPPAPPPGLFPEPTAEPTALPEAEQPAVDGTDGAALDAAVDAAVAATETASLALPAEPFALPGVPRTRPAARPADIPPVPTLPADVPAETPVETAVPAPEDNATLNRPTPRPEDLPAVTDTAAIDAAVDDAVQAALVNATELAVPASVKPSPRPANFERIVSAAQAGASDGSQVVAAAAVIDTVAPAIPTSASVATRATTENALNLREINLIGIYGSSNARRALVRLDNGRYVKVEVGDRLDGGKVTSISASRLTYQKGSRAYTLEVLPLG